MKIDNTRIIWIFGEAFLEKLGKSSGSKSPAEGRRGKMPTWQKSNWSIFLEGLEYIKFSNNLYI